MSIIHILDHQNSEIVGWITNVSYDSHQNSLDNNEKYEFIAPVTEEDLDKIQGRSRLLIPADEGDYREFIVYEKDDLTKQGEVEVYAEASYYDLRKLKTIHPEVRDGQTVEAAGTFVLQGINGWELGITEYSGIRKWTIEKDLDAYEALKAIASLFDCEIRFRVVISGNKVIGRFVDFVKKVGQDSGKEIVEGKDLLGIKRRLLAKRVVSALICLGPKREDGSQLKVTVTDEAAFQNWNWQGQHLVEVYEPQSTDTEMTEERLTQLGKAELKKRITAAVEYEAEGAALDHIFGYDHEVVHLGDSAKIKDEKFNPPMYLDSRVVFVERSIFNKSKKKYKLGEVIEYKKEDVFRVWKDLQALYATKVIKSPTPPKGKTNIIWIKTGGSVEIAHTWNPEINKWVPTGGSLYIWVMYADTQNGAGISSSPVGKAYVGFAYNKTEESPSLDPSEYEWMLLKGEQGVPGPPGEDGQPTYTWIKYADDSNGNGMSDNPSGKKYVGLSPNQSTDVESNVATDYKWVLFKGEKGDKGDPGERGLQGLQGPQGDQGIPGVKGETGRSSYTHVAYATNSTGTSGFSVSDPVNKTYIGIYVDQTSTDSGNPSKYKWTLIKGEKGDQGTPGPTGEDGLTPFLHIAYATNSIGTSGFSVSDSTGRTYIGTYTDYEQNDSTSPADYKWTLIKGEKGDKGDTGPQGPPGLQGIQGPKGEQGIKGATGADGRTSYTHIAYANNSTGTSGFSVGDSNGKTYIGMYTDFTEADSTTPSQYKWTLIKGADGNQGIQGPPGSNGQTPYFHTAWSNNSTGTSGFSTTSASGRTYIGTYTDFTSADSSDPSKYTWALLKGEKGDTGDRGPTGPTGPGGSQGEPGFKLDWVTSAYGKVDDQGRIYKNGGSSWYEGAYTKETYTDGVFLSFKPRYTSQSLMFGIHDDAPNANYYYYTSGYFMFYLASDGTARSRYSGTNEINHGAFSPGDSFVLVYDGDSVKYYKNGTLLRTVNTIPGREFSAMLSGSGSNSSYQLYDIYFAPSGARGPNKVDEHTTFGVDWLEANMIKSLNGLNINNQFKVDGSGNVEFSGHLNGATGSFSGKLNSSQMEVGPLNNDAGSSTIFGLQYNNTSDGGNTFYTDGIMAFEGWAGGLTLYHRKDGGGADFLTRFNISARSMDLKGGPFSADDINSRGSIEASGKIVSGSDIYFNNRALIASGSGTNTDHLWHDDGANAWHFVSDSTYKGTGNSKLVAGSLLLSSGVEIDPSGGSGRWKSGNGNYIYQNGDATGNRRGLVDFYMDDTIPFEFYSKWDDYGHAAIRMGKTTIQGLNGSTPALQIRNEYNTSYARIDASDFRTVSDERLKENMIEFEKNEILQEFLNIAPKQYSLISDETHTMRIGLSAQEAPEELRSDFGDELGIDLYAMNTYLWKVLQEAVKEIHMLKQGWHSHMN
ncbi:phage tail spike protein [Rossellomorea vietnamensis]|uniref:phage tail spike protein n=1 Tax=Rossellomorea vietnamensis TaxID=218284 RepID=UPI00068CCB58|nr:phage tail spike protein [Rossellomorea vietnamensis]